MLQVDHLDLNVGELPRAEKFYDDLTAFLGLKKVLRSDDLISYTDGTFGLYLVPSDMKKKFQPHAVGLNHLAFRAESREQVDELFKYLKEKGADILAPPRESRDYAQGYYSFFFRDPDRIRLEYAYCPRR